MDRPKTKSRFSFQQGTYGSVAPPSHVSGASYRTNVPQSAAPAVQASSGRDYFDEDDEDEAPVASGAPGDDADDYDPLDAFMTGIHEQVSKEKETVRPAQPLPEIVSGGYGDSDYDSSDDRDRAPLDSDEDEGNGSTEPERKARIEPLPAVDHSAIQYAPFRKNFYSEHAEIASMTEQEVAALRNELDVHVAPYSSARPVRNFSQLGLDHQLLTEIAAAGYERPTAIQAQTVPVVLSGRDVIALAKTGSGKTLAYLWPMIVHILAQPQMQLGDGPIGLVLAPTRELAAQIHSEAKKFATKVYNIRVVAVYGGGGKYEMSRALKETAPELVIATPGRFIEMVRNKSTNLRRCTLVVLDEADRMFEMGFEYQMRSIVNNIRPDRQVLMFSATMKRRIESFAREILKDEVKVTVGRPGQANADIQQSAVLFAAEEEKLNWLRANIDEFAADGKVLIFVLSKAGTEAVTAELKALFARRQLQIGVDCLHGDKDQVIRTRIMQQFSRPSDRTDAVTVLVATDIASRGLDVKDIRTVINYDVAKNIETYVHRIGRTGTAYTLLTPKDSSFACDLVVNLELSRQAVPAGLLQLAQGDPKWQRIRHGHRGGSGGGGGGGGFSGGAGAGAGIGKGGLGFGAAGVAQGRASVALTSSMLANKDFRSSSSSQRWAAGDMQPPAQTSEQRQAPPQLPALSSLPPGLREKFQRASAANADRAVSSAPVGHASHEIPPLVPHMHHQQPYGGSGYAQPPPVPANNDYAANPYMAGHSQGRGRHLTQPSWMSNGNSTPPSAAGAGQQQGQGHGQPQPSTAANQSQFADFSATQGASEAGAKRKSRFENSAESQPASLVTGFVRASDTSASSTATVHVSDAVPPLRQQLQQQDGGDSTTSLQPPPQPAPAPTKRSRWDT